jgi:small nuclear ribonucleoprotein (snRNP)-like protein
MLRRSRDRLIRFAMRDRFAITLTSGETVEGVLYDADDTTVILADACAITDRGDRTPLDGWVYLPRAHVLYLQRPYQTPRG